jgi:hypothetical protein
MNHLKAAKAPLPGAFTKPQQTETRQNNHRNGSGCQPEVVAVRETQSSWGSPLSAPSRANKTRTAETRAPRNGYYEPVAVAFRLGGFNYRQIAREGDWAIYEQRWNGCANPSACYEVVHIRKVEAITFPSGRFYPAREVYPPSEAWGIAGFTVTDRDAAFNKLRLQLSPARTGTTKPGDNQETLEQTSH